MTLICLKKLEYQLVINTLIHLSKIGAALVRFRSHYAALINILWFFARSFIFLISGNPVIQAQT